MSISIIIPNYNGLEMLKQCLKSLDESILKPTEIIIVDNGSSDHSVEWVSENYPNIICIVNENNKGFSPAVNQGIAISKYKYVILLNNDVVVKNTWLQHLIDIAETNENIFSVSSKMLQYYNPDLIDDAGDSYTILGWAYKRGDGTCAETNYNKTDNIFSACAGAALYRRSILNEIGYFDENFFAYLEDVDLGFRALNAGYTNIFCSNAIVYHIGSATSGSKYNTFKIALTARNSVWLMYKNFHPFHWIVNLPFIIIGFMVKFIFFSIKGFGFDYLKSSLNAFKKLPDKKQIIPISTVIKIEIFLIKNTFIYLLKKIHRFIVK
jgi:GT2 family glycosyltransferase